MMDTTRSERLAALPSLARFEPLAWLAALLLAVALLPGTSSLVRNIDGIIGDMPFQTDFTRHFWRQAHELAPGKPPVGGYYYSAFFALMLRPLGALPLPVASAIWLLVQLGSIVALALCGRRWLDERQRLVYPAALLLSVPLLHDLRWGQVSLLLGALSLGGFVLYERGRKGWAALLLAIPIAIKLYPALLLLVFLLRRDFRFVLLCAAFTVGLALSPALYLGFDGLVGFQEAIWLESSSALSAWVWRNPNAQSPGIVLTHYGLFPPFKLLSWMGLVPVAAVAGVALVRGWRRAPSLPAGFLAVSSLGLLLTPTAWPHYFVHLPLALAWLLPRRPRPLLALGWGLLAVAMSALLSCTVGWMDYAYRGALCLTNLIVLGWIAWSGAQKEPAG